MEVLFKLIFNFNLNRSQWLRSRIRQAKEARDKHLEKIYGNATIRQKDLPPLEVKITEANAEAFELLLKFIYTDRIDLTKQCKLPIYVILQQILIHQSIYYYYDILFTVCTQVLNLKNIVVPL